MIGCFICNWRMARNGVAVVPITKMASGLQGPELGGLRGRVGRGHLVLLEAEDLDVLVVAGDVVDLAHHHVAVAGVVQHADLLGADRTRIFVQGARVELVRRQHVEHAFALELDRRSETGEGQLRDFGAIGDAADGDRGPEQRARRTP